MLETSKKYDEDKVTNDNNISFSRYPVASFPSVLVKYSNKKDASLMIEAEKNDRKFERLCYFFSYE